MSGMREMSDILCIYVTEYTIAYIILLLFQIDNPAQLATVLLNITGSGSAEIESADVSLTVGVLDIVTQSTEDLQQKDVSC